MSYHGKLQVLKQGKADAEIQLWAYQQLEKETKPLSDEEILIICFFDTGITTWKLSDGNMDAEMMLNFARAIEAKVRGEK